MKAMRIIFVISLGIVSLILPGSEFDKSSTLEAKVAIYNGQPLSQFTTTLFAGSGVCASCHSNLRDYSNADVSMDTHWRSTMMANAARDPLWQAKVSSEVKRNPHLEGVIEGKCSTCHMPMAKTQAHQDNYVVEILGNGFVNGNHNLNNAAMEGVSCTLCHQIKDENLGEEVSFSGGYNIDTARSKPSRLIYGQYTNPSTRPMSPFSGYTPSYSRHVDESELCATCHTLFTPYVDSSGEVKGEFPEQTPYLEWQNSNYAKSLARSCQDCHMPLANGSVSISNRGRRQSRSPFFQHHFVGGNAYMLNLMKESAQNLELTTSSANIDATIARTRNQLQSNAATIKINSAKTQNSSLEIIIKVRNKTGHKFPTGIPIRRSWIQLSVEDSNGKTIFTSGLTGKNGEIIGNAADENSKEFEPHYTVISDPDQVQIYEAVMANTDGDVTYTLLRAAEYLKDNRLLPVGFKKKSVENSVAVFGEAYADKNFRGGSDKTTYRVDLGESKGPFVIKAKLMYQSVSYRFLKDLEKDKTNEVRNFKKLKRKVDNLPELVAEATKTVT